MTTDITTAQPSFIQRVEPRDPDAAFQRALATVRNNPDFAEQAFYNMSRGGKSIQGPSVRLAELMLYHWGNIRAQSRIVGDDGKSIIAEAVCYDMEKGNAVSVEIRRRITDKNGNRYSDDMVVVTGNAAAAIALRNAVLKIIPAIYITPLFEEAKKTAVGSATSDQDRRNKALKFFAGTGITTEALLKHIERPSIDQINGDDLEYLLGLATALKDGDTTPDAVLKETRTGKPAKLKPTKMDDLEKDIAPPDPPVAENATSEPDRDYPDADDLRNQAVGLQKSKKIKLDDFDGLCESVGIIDMAAATVDQLEALLDKLREVK